MDADVAKEIIDFLTSSENKWTLIVSSKNPYWKEKCTRKITMEEGKISNDTKTI
jgi:predicted ABC-type transport system involved in lysophospholipase L1 biosynthesis ATPase subunit